MSARWTRRRSGDVRTTIRVEYHVNKELFDWIQERTRWSEAKTLWWIRQHANDIYEQWCAVAIVDGEPEVRNEDEDLDDVDVYVGSL